MLRTLVGRKMQILKKKTEKPKTSDGGIILLCNSQITVFIKIRINVNSVKTIFKMYTCIDSGKDPFTVLTNNFVQKKNIICTYLLCLSL